MLSIMPNHSRTNSISDLDIYVGLDIHKKSWKVNILGPSYEHKTFSQDPDTNRLYSYLNRHFPGARVTLAYEAGFSGFNLARELLSLGLNCLVVNPMDVPTIHRDRNQKSDKKDARKIAAALRGGLLEGIYIPDEEIRAHYSLLLQRRSLVQDLGRYKNRIKSYLLFTGIPIPDAIGGPASRHWSKNYITWLMQLSVAKPHRQVIHNNLSIGLKLREELKTVNRQIRDLANTPAYKKNAELLIGVPGIGVLSAMMILTKIGDIGRFRNADQMNSFFGLIPSTHSSGEKVSSSGITSRGIKQLRNIIIEASWVAVRVDPAMMVKFEQLVKTMQKNKAIIRIARSLLNRIRRVLKTGTPYKLGVQ